MCCRCIQKEDALPMITREFGFVDELPYRLILCLLQFFSNQTLDTCLVLVKLHRRSRKTMSMQKRALPSSSSSGQPSQPKRPCLPPIDQAWNGSETNLMPCRCLTKEDVWSVVREVLERAKSHSPECQSCTGHALEVVAQRLHSIEYAVQKLEHGDAIVMKALANWNDVREFNGETFSDSMQKNSSSSYSSSVLGGQTENHPTMFNVIWLHQLLLLQLVRKLLLANTELRC
ncbi:uncharacterized protein LOC104438711 [Eucalyptus grandis]|uniref:uncharacterized protein LOC104438711 n=1 Tax=Eucalyptus grandis TaxID=71139 RepID=UPI00192E9DF0|nr:uncharacterized protein LOC104438711 [Eucalyptus grandis]